MTYVTNMCQYTHSLKKKKRSKNKGLMFKIVKASSKMDCDNVMRPQKILNESVNLASFSELNLSNPIFFIP